MMKKQAPIMMMETESLPSVNGSGIPQCGDAKTALIVDDYPGIYALIAPWMLSLGYRSLAAADGKEAQGMMIQQGISNIDLLITDLDMPRMRGDELMEWFLHESPGSLGLVMSGRIGDTKLGEGVVFLQKPFSRDTFMAGIHQLLGHPPEQNPASEALRGKPAR